MITFLIDDQFIGMEIIKDAANIKIKNKMSLKVGVDDIKHAQIIGN